MLLKGIKVVNNSIRIFKYYVTFVLVNEVSASKNVSQVNNGSREAERIASYECSLCDHGRQCSWRRNIRAIMVELNSEIEDLEVRKKDERKREQDRWG